MALKCADDPRYADCPFEPPEGRIPEISIMRHRKEVHEGGTNLQKARGAAAVGRDKLNFLALYINVGSVKNALEYAPDHYLVVDPQVAAIWAEHYDEGQVEVPQEKIARWERKLRATEEWDARKTNRMNRRVLQKADQAFLDGEKSLQELGTAHRYVGDNWHWGEKAVKEAYGKEVVREQPISVGRLVINAGQPPPKRLKAGKPAKIIDAEVREITKIGDADRT